MVEHMFLMAAIGLFSMVGLQILGNVVDGQLVTAIVALAQIEEEPEEPEAGVPDGSDPEAAAGTGTCPTGWTLAVNATNTKKNGQNVDANGDGLICRKEIPAKGKGKGKGGNTNLYANVKDNNGD